MRYSSDLGVHLCAEVGLIETAAWRNIDIRQELALGRTTAEQDLYCATRPNAPHAYHDGSRRGGSHGDAAHQVGAVLYNGI